jgi:hypothetical protein
MLRYGADGFTSHPKEGVLRILMDKFDPAHLGSNTKHANHYTTVATTTCVSLIWSVQGKKVLSPFFPLFRFRCRLVP